MPGPADGLLQRLLKVSLYERLIIPLAEDLGDITPEVHRLRDRLGIAGYKTFIFGWGEGERSGIASGYRYPEEYGPAFLATTGTHDTPTLKEWWRDLCEGEKSALLDYLSLQEGCSFRDVRDAVFRRLFDSEARFVVLPFQDVFALGKEHRINFPGTFGRQNWTWRMPWTVRQLVSGEDGKPDRECRILRRMIAESGRAAVSRGERLRAEGERRKAAVEIEGVLPLPGSVQVRKRGEFFNVWAAVRGEPKRVTMTNNLAGETEMRKTASFKDGITLYEGSIRVDRGGEFSLGVSADGISVTAGSLVTEEGSERTWDKGR